jgi:hypothetical protein
LSFGLRAVLGFEHQLIEHWRVSLGIAYRANFGGHATGAIELPMTVRYLF